MPLPQRPVVALALAAAYAATSYARRAQTPAQTPALAASASVSASVATFAAAFVAAYGLQAAAYAAWAVFLYPHLLSPLRHLPQPRDGNHFLLGQFRRIAREPTGQPAQEWINTIPNDGLIRYLGIFNTERLLVTKPKALAEVLVGRSYDFEKPAFVRQAMEVVLGVGVLLAEGDEHRFQRRQLAPAFAFRHVKDLYPVFWSKGREAAEAMQAAVKDGADGAGALEVNGWASRTTLDIIGVAGLGRDFGAIQDPGSELAATYHLMLHPDKQARLLNMLGLVLPRWFLRMLPLRRNAEIAAANARIKRVCRGLIAEKRQQLDPKDSNQDKDKDSDRDSELDILSVALASGGFSDDSLVAQLMTFLAAGHETTSSALTWAVYQLCVHPAMQDRLRREIRDNLPPLAGRAPSAAEIDQLPFLHAVCSEVLRYMAPVPSTLREARVDTVIQGQRVPRGTLVMLVPWAVNRSEELWGPTAAEFDPERWLADSSGGAASNYAFMTFLHGPRSCIGLGFARAEFACVLAAWVGRFAFRLQDPAELDEANLKIQGSVSSRPKNGLHVYASVVEGW